MTEPRYHRREFLARAGQVAAAGRLARPAAAAGWDDMRQILDRIKAPAFPDRDFNVTRYGAVADGKTGCTGAIAQCHLLYGAKWFHGVTQPVWKHQQAGGC